MLIKNTNLVFFVSIILCLELNPFLSMNALTKEKKKMSELNERDVEEIDHEKKNYFSSLFPEEKRLRSTPLFPKYNIQYEKVSQKTNSTVIGKLFFGSIGSFGFGVIGGIIGSSLNTEEGWFAGLGEAIIGYLIGSTLGSSIGVYTSAPGDETGSFVTTLGGSILGTAAGIGILYIFSDNDVIVGLIGYTLAQSAGATIAFNASVRKHEYNFANDAMFQLKEGKCNFSYPKIHLTSHPLQPNKLIKTITLLNVEF